MEQWFARPVLAYERTALDDVETAIAYHAAEIVLTPLPTHAMTALVHAIDMREWAWFRLHEIAWAQIGRAVARA